MFEPEIRMKLVVAIAAALALIGTSAVAKSVRQNTAAPAHRTAPPADRYFDAAHGTNDPHSLWLAGDYVGRDPDQGIRAAMMRAPYN